MKTKLISLTLLISSLLPTFAQDPTPVWELNQNTLAAANKTGEVNIHDGVVELNGENTFEIPASAIGDRQNFTVEFEIRRSPKFEGFPRMVGALKMLSNVDNDNHTGFELVYFPPGWDKNGGVGNRIGVDVNGYWNGEIAGFSGNDFNKITFLVQDGLPSIYRNGLLISLTGDLNSSQLPLTVGGWGGRSDARYNREAEGPLTEPYELRNLKIYGEAIVPKGYDSSVDIMRNVSGDNYHMQRAIIEDETLPRILVIGDSISMGYRRFITEHFEGKAYVDYWVGSGVPWGQETLTPESKVARAWKGVLSNGPYDVVTWNAMTLHWWHTRQLNRAPEDRVALNMRDTIRFLKQTAPQTDFIWVRCTPIRLPLEDGTHVLDERPNYNPRIVRYNGIVDEVVDTEGLPSVDLYAIAVTKLDTITKGSKDTVHWPKEVSQLFAEAIITEIEKHLN